MVGLKFRSLFSLSKSDLDRIQRHWDDGPWEKGESYHWSLLAIGGVHLHWETDDYTASIRWAIDLTRRSIIGYFKFWENPGEPKCKVREEQETPRAVRNCHTARSGKYFGR